MFRETWALKYQEKMLSKDDKKKKIKHAAMTDSNRKKKWISNDTKGTKGNRKRKGQGNRRGKRRSGGPKFA